MNRKIAVIAGVVLVAAAAGALCRKVPCMR